MFANRTKRENFKRLNIRLGLSGALMVPVYLGSVLVFGIIYAVGCAFALQPDVAMIIAIVIVVPLMSIAICKVNVGVAMKFPYIVEDDTKKQ